MATSIPTAAAGDAATTSVAVAPRHTGRPATPKTNTAPPSTGTPAAQPGTRRGPVERRRYLPVTGKFMLAQVLALAWVALSVWLSRPWVAELTDVAGLPVAVVVIAGVAYLPGWLVAFLAASLLLDRQPPARLTAPTTAVTVLIAAYNEERGIGQTLEYLARQDHRGPLHVLLADNNSTDNTVAVARATAERVGLPLTVITAAEQGKNFALNEGLRHVTTPLVATVDADTLLHPGAVRRLVARMESSPARVDAVAGAVLSRNSRASWWTRMQEWDYFLGIASVKRMQGLYQGTLVAQGAFSVYRTDAVRAAGGWPDAIGEDIVLTWRMLHNGGLVYYEPLAVAFTDTPETFRHLARQRSRWARGMIEGLRTVPPWRQRHPLTRWVAGLNLAIPLIDAVYTFIWMPGLLLALTGNFLIVGPYTLAVLPVTFAVYALLYRYQRRAVFDRLGLRVRRNRLGLLAYLLLYQLVLAPVSVWGYLQEVTGARRRWK